MTALINCCFSQLLDDKRAINKCRIKNSTYAHSTDMLNKRIAGSAMVHCNTIKVWMTGTEKKKSLFKGDFENQHYGGARIHRAFPLLSAVHLTSQRPPLIHLTSRPMSRQSRCAQRLRPATLKQDHLFIFIFFFADGVNTRGSTAHCQTTTNTPL